MRDSKKEDVLFLLPALIIWILTLIVSFGGYDAPIYSIRSPVNIVGAMQFLARQLIRLHAAMTLDKSYS